MPCRSDPDESYYRQADSATQQQLDLLTRLLCEAADTLEKIPYKGNIHDNRSAELKAWHENHKKEDEKREAEDKNDALRKLTPNQRRLLNLPDPT